MTKELVSIDYRTIRQEVIDFAQGQLDPDALADAISRVFDYCLEHGYESIDRIDPDVFVNLMDDNEFESDRNVEVSEALADLNLRTVDPSDIRFRIAFGHMIRLHCLQDVMRDWADLTDLLGMYYDECWRDTEAWQYIEELRRIMGRYIKEAVGE